MNEEKELISLFPTPLVKANIGRSFTKEELECITNIPMTREGERGRWKKIEGAGGQSESYDIFNKFEELKDLKTFCEGELKVYLEDIEGVNTDITNLNITTSWLNKIEPQDSHTLHNHRNSYLSGVLYIHCLPDDNIQFTNRHLMFNQSLQLPIKKTTQFNAASAAVKIKEGDFIIFPSLVLHQVGMNETKDKERLSLSFDTWPTYLPSLYPPYK